MARVIDGARGRREWAADGLIWAALSAPIAGNRLLSPTVAGCAGAVAAVAAVGAAVLLARRAPLAGLIIVVLGSVFDGNFAFAIPVLSYLAGLRTERVRPVALGFLVILAGGTVLNLGVLRTGPAQWFMLTLTLLAVGVFPWLVGRYRAQQGRLVSAGWERAARLEFEHRIVVRQAQLRERARIAQEMHDGLGHELSLIALGAGALQTSPGLAGTHQATAGRIREAAATATDQLREIIGVLRDEDEPAPLHPADERVEALVTRARAAGLPVTVRRTGPAAPAAVERTAYQVVREALTNVSRHAPGAATTVELTRHGDATTVAVVNDAPVGSPPGGTTTGLGLAGLQERLRLAGGRLTAGPTGDGGFRISADLPHRPGRGPYRPPPAVELRSARRQARRSLTAAVLTPAVLAIVAACGYYAFAAAGSVLSGDAYDRIAIGTPRGDLAPVLPDRQARQRSGGASPPGAECEEYSDGNFPMADAAYRLCFAGGRLVAKQRLR
jgi:signal transduction histidine kinase